MEDKVIHAPFSGRTSAKLKKVFGYNDLQVGVDDVAGEVMYILRGDEAMVNQVETFLVKANAGKITYDAAAKKFQISGLDGATATFEIYSFDEIGIPDLEDTLPLSGGKGDYTFTIPIPGKYIVVAWGDTKFASLAVEV